MGDASATGTGCSMASDIGEASAGEASRIETDVSSREAPGDAGEGRGAAQAATSEIAAARSDGSTRFRAESAFIRIQGSISAGG
jgi:hypothetical protein